MWYYTFAMRTIVLYESKVGSTKKYAEDIAMGISAEVMPLKKFKWKKISDYDTIVFGGWVLGGKIKGIDEFLSHYHLMEDKNVLIFSSGMSYVTKESRDTLISQNLLDMYHVRYYQFRGSFDFNKLGPVQKLMISNSLRMMSRDSETSADADYVARLKETPLEYYDQAGVDKILSVLHRLENEPIEVNVA